MAETLIVESPAVQAPVSNPSILDPRVERGAALLDERLPGWANTADPDTLIMDRPCHCVLGQLFGDFYQAIDRLEIHGEDYGFDAVWGRNRSVMDDFALLEQDWRLAILSRRVLHTGDCEQSPPDSCPRVVARLREAAERSEHE